MFTAYKVKEVASVWCFAQIESEVERFIRRFQITFYMHGRDSLIRTNGIEAGNVRFGRDLPRDVAVDGE